MSTSTHNLVGQFESSYVLALVTAKRAKQLREGAPQLVECESNHSITIALEEIAQHKIRAVMPDLVAEELQAQIDLNEEEILNMDAGLALPALDEEAEAAVAPADLAALLDDEEEDHEAEPDEITAGISSLVGDDEDEEVVDEEVVGMQVLEMDGTPVVAEVDLEDDEDAEEDDADGDGDGDGEPIPA